ncbi:nitroreductase family protein [Desulfovibrio gilichinskyi]|uniref:Nitroreductase n=1 Tax=Desulfovibrio gilichinskyi TaxID=1519643 RepID=A0A1X7CXH7_9BACT|nr:nitroreductase family protein [Desulfovibrio gilichinskyi]SMF04833.1 Nitroreductase [Desulfovibrio gilichinskyi]
MIQLKIDEELCIGCGDCAADCIHQIIELSDGIPSIISGGENNCLQCQHCLAVCPTGALSIMGLDPQDSLQLPADVPSSLQMENLIKSRRSTRQYRQENVDAETLDKLLKIIAYAPTGMNRQKVLLTVINDIETMDTLRQRTYTAIQDKINRNEPLSDKQKWLVGYIHGWQNGADYIYRHAPHMIIASAPRGIGTPLADCVIALSYFELQSATMGLGTTWCGLAIMSLNEFAPELLTELGIPDDHEVGYMMLFGEPTVTYHRTVQITSDRVNFPKLKKQ